MKRQTNLICALLLSTLPALLHAQDIENSYDFSINQKGYVVKPVSNDFLMAGTYFNVNYPTTSNGSVHTINTNVQGFINTTTLFAEQGSDIIDTRVADMVSIGSNQHAIVARTANVTNSGFNNIRIQIVDDYGIGNGYYTISSNNSVYRNLYPIRALYNPDLNLLHICGYAAGTFVNANTPPSWGATNGDKVAFVLNFNLTTNTVSNLQFFNSGFSPAPATTIFNNDFDIATRMSYYTSGGTPYLIVTGSANMVHNPVTFPTQDHYVSGTNVMVLKASALTIEQNITICDKSAAMGIDAEYGNDLKYDDIEKRLYVLGNNHVSPSAGSQVNPDLKNFMITVLRLDFTTFPISLNIAGHSRIVHNTSMTNSLYAWGHQFLTSTDNNSMLVVSGYQNDAPGSYVTPVQPSNNNINGFLSTINFHIGTGALPSFTSASSFRWTTMLNFTGTISSTSNPSYFLMGGTYSNLAWMPDNATEVGMQKIQVAPYEKTGNNYLKLKFSRTDVSQTISACPNAASEELSNSYTFGLASIHTNGTSSVTPILSVLSTTASTNTGTYVSTTPTYLFQPCNASFGYKRTGNTTLNAATTKTTIHPNPAQDYISVTLSGVSATEKVFVTLYDVTGRMVSELYNGPAGTMNSKLQLPNIASGLYTIQVKTSSKILTKEKLSIQ